MFILTSIMKHSLSLPLASYGAELFVIIRQPCYFEIQLVSNWKKQYVLYYIECPSEGGIVEGGIAEGGIVGCGISLQYHPLLWWAGLRKVREKYHIYTYPYVILLCHLIQPKLIFRPMWLLVSFAFTDVNGTLKARCWKMFILAYNQ
jgi:hypothetical protein